MIDYLDPIIYPIPQGVRYGTPVVHCPRCTLIFIGRGAHQAYADHSWTHVHLRETS